MFKSLGIIAALLLASASPALAIDLSSVFGPNWNVINNYPYGPDPSEVADFYLLKGQGHPAVIFIHGGAWVGGDKSAYAGYYANKYGNAGISVISINYRLATLSDPKTQWPAQLQDAQLAVRFVKQYWNILGIDPNRICVFGDSAGGQIVQFLGSLKTNQPGDRSSIYPSQSPAVACVVDMFGPADMTDRAFEQGIDGTPLFGGKTYAQAPQAYAAASPIRYVTPQTSPIMMIYGLNDTIVPFEQAQSLQTVLNQNHVQNYLIPFSGGHWFQGTPSDQKTAADNYALSFVRMYLHP
jgi:acetyl esterase/lipase